MGNEKTVRRPNSRRNLDLALQRKCGAGASLVQARMTMACAIIGQLVPGAVVKGGTSLRLRYGRANSRNTIDCDVARRCDIDKFASGVRQALAIGWNGFGGTLVEKRPAKPRGVPTEYVMQPYEVKLQTWPSAVVKGEKWQELYDSQKGSLKVLPDLESAIAWANDLIARIDAAK